MQTKSTMSYFNSSFLALLIGGGLGFMLDGLSGVFFVLVLSALEISLSFDNAVVNASVLKNWDSSWRRLFLWVGLPIAVFGMRLVFPIMIVTVTTGMGAMETFHMALNEPARYAVALTAVHHQVAAFGGAFLMMVAFEFFIDEDKDNHWIEMLEQLMIKLGTYQKAVSAGIVLTILVLMSNQLPAKEGHEFLVAGVIGIIAYVAVKFFAQILSGGEDDGKIVAQGIGGLIYLEILDASFSFDGVIGAFAITNHLLTIMIGLGVGAMFVRSLTIYLVDKGTLTEYRYLEHGAFWAILALSIIMFVGVSHEIPEVVTGLIGLVLIGASFWHSVNANKRDAASSALTSLV